ncbi:MAG TPA: alpha/beta hydrolase [Roseiflexaceae bacterium]|nr:alpha/beta hydrolase [Roseiflexaceae bacterium]
MLLFLLAACAPSSSTTGNPPPITDVFPTPALDGLAGERREIRFLSDGVELAGELSLPPGTAPAPLVFIIHHSGPVGRDAYGYLAELLLPAGYAVFRFDKRGVGASGGSYGCCEAQDALAAYRVVVVQPGIDRNMIFIIAQSRGTQHLADHYGAYTATAPPRAVALLSNLLGPDRITIIAAPTLIIVSDSEPDLETIGAAALAAQRQHQPFDTELFIAAGSEHSLFDISDGPIDWSDPQWVQRYHRAAMAHLIRFLDKQR